MTSPSSETRPDSATESYFVGKLAEYARRPDVAAPATIDSLVSNLDYLTEEQIAEVTRAYEYAELAHDGQMRRTGHRYITHPVAVAEILAKMRMDHQTLMAALLHDVIEDSDTSKTALGERFSKPVAEIVDGLSKLKKIFDSRDEAQAENFQKMAMAMAKDEKTAVGARQPQQVVLQQSKHEKNEDTLKTKKDKLDLERRHRRRLRRQMVTAGKQITAVGAVSALIWYSYETIVEGWHYFAVLAVLAVFALMMMQILKPTSVSESERKKSC